MNEFDSLFAALKICCDCRLIIINFRVFMEFGSWFYFEANVDKRRGFWDLDFFLFEDEFEKSLLLLRTKLKWVFYIQMIWIWIRNCHFIHNCDSVFFFFFPLPSLSSFSCRMNQGLINVLNYVHVWWCGWKCFSFKKITIKLMLLRWFSMVFDVLV